MATDTRNWAERERDELHRLLIYIRGVEADPLLHEQDKEQLTRKQYIRVVQLNTEIINGPHRLAS